LFVCLFVCLFGIKREKIKKNARVIGSKLEEMEQKTVVESSGDIWDCDKLKRNIDNQYRDGWYVHHISMPHWNHPPHAGRDMGSGGFVLVVYRKD